MTKRKLSDDDLKGLKKEDLERLRCHIYARHGYNFNVNDGLYYINKIAKHYFPNYISIDYISDLNELRRKTGCVEFVILASDLYRLYSSKRFEEMSEKEKDEVRKSIEGCHFKVFEDDMSRLYNFKSKIGYFDRNGKWGHEGEYYYLFQDCDWYKPTTCKKEEVYSKMSDIEKHNVEFIKAHEAKAQ